MNLNFRRRDRRHQEMDFSLPASLFLLSVVFWQFVSAADQNHSPIKAEPGQSAFLPCKDSDEGGIQVVEWSRTDLESGFVLLYRDGKIDLENQHPSYRDRMDLLVNQIQKRDASLVLQNTTIADSGTYECRVKQTNRGKKLISTVSLVVAPPPEPFPVWATVLLVLLVLLSLALVAAAVLSFYFWLCWKPGPESVEVEPGEKFVLLPFKVPHRLWFIKYRIFLPVDKVEWKDGNDDVVHVYQNGSDQPGEQHQFYRTRTKMDENLLKTGDLSLTLKWPKESDNYTFTCTVYNKNGDILIKKDIRLKVKVKQVEVESGVKSVLLPWRITEDLDGVVRVEWMDRENKKVHVYQNGSDQPGEQNQIYKDRTKMDGNLKNKDLSLTLMRPTSEDRGIYTCRVYNKDGTILMKKQINLQVKVPKVVVESGVESVELPCRTRENLGGDVKVEWKDGDNRTVHVYQNGSDQPEEQDEIYRTRTKMDGNLKNKNLSLTLMKPKERDSNIYTCRIYRGDSEIVRRVWLEVKGHQVEVESGVESVELPWIIREDLDGNVKVEWKDRYNRKVHVYQNGSDQPGEQSLIYKDRTKMDENLLKNKNLSLTLSWPRFGDTGIYTCSVYKNAAVVLMEKQINLQVKVKQVEVEPGVKSVELPCRTRENLDGVVRVEWKDGGNRMVHVYQNGSDQPGEQDEIYRTRTKMDKNLLRNKNLSLTLMRPTERDFGIYTCRVYNIEGTILMMKDVQLKVKGTVRVQNQPEDTRTRRNSIDLPLI